MKTLLIISLIFISACTKMHDVETKNGIDYLEDIQSKISNVKNVEWSVGKKKNKIVSRGIRLGTDVPRISDSAKEKLYKKYGIDSWLFKFVKTTGNRTRILGNVFYHFNNISRNTTSFSLNIYYHSASVSRQFRNFHCPAFNHRLLIKDLSLENETDKVQDLYIREMNFETGRASKLSFSPHIFSSGKSLKGRFHVQYALYNSKTKQIFSDWRQADGFAVVGSERAVSLPSCIGVKEEKKPLRKSKDFNLNDLKIN